MNEHSIFLEFYTKIYPGTTRKKLNIIETINIIDLKMVMPELTEDQLCFLLGKIEYMMNEYP